MDRPNAATITKATIEGDACEIHIRRDHRSGEVQNCDVYVRPQGPVPGYWYTVPAAVAEALVFAGAA